MSRVALTGTKKLVILVVTVTLLAAGITGAVIANSPGRKVGVSVNSQNQTTYINYNGVNGQTALALLKKHARVQVKYYSFGDLVQSINGTPGNGPKYWTFYVNGKEANSGAGTYVTKNSDKIEWRLR